MDEKSGPRILMVEDDQLLASILAQRFAAESIGIVHAATGEEALQRLGEGGLPDLMLLDLHLPGMDGFEVLEKLRANPLTAKFPVIVLSNFNEPEDIERSRRLGALRHIQKVSLMPNEIVDVVKKELEALRS